MRLALRFSLAFAVALGVGTVGTTASGEHDTKVALCLSSVDYAGEGHFRWGGTGAAVGAGTCPDVQAAFGLCPRTTGHEASSGRPPRDCLLARVPWQTHVALARCCFSCCMGYWQEALGLAAVYRHWFESKAYTPARFQRYYEPSGIPPLDSVLLAANSVKRFSLFMWEQDAGKPVTRVFNATHLPEVAAAGGGGVVQASHGGIQVIETCLPFRGRLLKSSVLLTRSVEAVWEGVYRCDLSNKNHCLLLPAHLHTPPPPGAGNGEARSGVSQLSPDERLPVQRPAVYAMGLLFCAADVRAGGALLLNGRRGGRRRGRLPRGSTRSIAGGSVRGSAGGSAHVCRDGGVRAAYCLSCTHNHFTLQ